MAVAVIQPVSTKQKAGSAMLFVMTRDQPKKGNISNMIAKASPALSLSEGKMDMMSMSRYKSAVILKYIAENH